MRSSPATLPDSVEVTAEGIWAVGFGDVQGTRIARIDPATLQVRPVGSGDAAAPQGAEGWPGEAVFWVRDAYSNDLTCHDARTGAQVASFRDVGSPANPQGVKIVSRHGAAFAISGTDLVRLHTTQACPG